MVICLDHKAMLFDVFKFYIQDVILCLFCNISLVNFIFMSFVQYCILFLFVP